MSIWKRIVAITYNRYMWESAFKYNKINQLQHKYRKVP